MRVTGISAPAPPGALREKSLAPLNPRAAASKQRDPVLRRGVRIADAKGVAAFLQKKIDPASRTVAVKLSYFPPGNMEAAEETNAFLAAASESSVR